MPLISPREMLAAARRAGYAVCYCESWNLESLEAVMDAAEECRAPVIAGFNGGFLWHHGRAKPEKLAYYAGFWNALDRSTVPVALLLNESDSPEQIREAMSLPFNAIMVENEGRQQEEYRALVAEVVSVAHPANIWVEAQLGCLPGGAPGHEAEFEATDPEAARAFVESTGVDALAVSVGNVHVLTRGTAGVDFEALRRIRDRVDVPLVLHGGTGIAPECLPGVIELGVAKLNYGTNLKQAYLDAVRAALDKYRAPASPHEFLGKGGPADIMTAGRAAVKEKVKELLALSGSAGKA
jgi:ketose-bisphosphate aldolase